MTAHAAPITLSILFALACSRPSSAPSTVDAETTASSSERPAPAPLPATTATCWRVNLDSAGTPWLWPVPCSNVRPGGEPTPIAGICCTTPSGPCIAVELASSCETPNWFYPCDAGYETVDGNGEPTVICYDNATGAALD